MRFRLPPGLIALALVTAVAVPASASDLNDRIGDASQALDAANRDVRIALRKIERTRGAIPRVQARLADAESTVERFNQENLAAEARIESIRIEAATLQNTIDGVNDQIDVTQGTVNDIARAMYQEGAISQIGAVLNATDPGDFTRRIATVESISRANREVLATLNAQSSELAMDEVRVGGLQQQATQEQAMVQQRLDAARTAEAKAQRARNRLVRLRAQQQRALKAARQHADDVKARYDQLRAEQARIVAAAAAAAAAQAQNNGGHANDGHQSSAQTTVTSSGALMWPIPGASVSQEVGPRIHPVYGYKSCHTGVDIRGGTGTPIHAAADGTVISISNGGAYGLATLISHANGLSTFYAHQSSTAVHDGERVSKGEVIGYVGSSGWVTGPHLHFEVHIAGKAYDPMGWFGGNRSPVSC